MLKQLIFFLLLFIAAVCTSCVIRPEMTREQYRKQEEIIGSVRIIRAQMRALAAVYRPIRRERMSGMPFGFNHPWTVGEDAQMCFVEVYNIPQAMCENLVRADTGAAKVLVNGSMWGFCTPNSHIRWLFAKFPAYSREEYLLDIRKAAQ